MRYTLKGKTHEVAQKSIQIKTLIQNETYIEDALARNQILMSNLR